MTFNTNDGDSQRKCVSKKCQHFYYKYIPDIKTKIRDGYVWENKAIQFLYTHWKLTIRKTIDKNEK